TLTGGGPPGRNQESRGPRHLAMEVARVQCHTPHRLVHPTKLAHGELGRTEGGGERGILDLGTCSLHSVRQDASVVEGKRRCLAFLTALLGKQGLHRCPPCAVGVATSGGSRKIR